MLMFLAFAAEVVHTIVDGLLHVILDPPLHAMAGLDPVAEITTLRLQREDTQGEKKCFCFYVLYFSIHVSDKIMSMNICSV